MGLLKKPIKRIAGLSEGEAKQDLNVFEQGQAHIEEALKSQHDVIAGVAKMVNFAIKQMKHVTVESMLNTDDVDAFTKIKDRGRNGVCYIQEFPTYVDSIVSLAAQGVHISDQLRSKANDIGYRHEKHGTSLFEKREKSIMDTAQHIKKNAKDFADTVYALQGMEDENKDTELIKKNMQQAESSLKALAHGVHHLTKAFNHALKAAEDISKDDIRMEKLLEDHLILLRDGEYKQKAASGRSEAQEALHAAINNRDDELFTGSRGRHGGQLRTVLKQYNERKYGEEKEEEKKLRELKLTGT
ncbi:hypothetical protein GF367_03435 [Candidatus Woesearchaeota archaeon]|nr:hypothetical protein [Candidatus Woesearchaeota archaeon]